MNSYFGASVGFMDKRDISNIGDYYPTPPIATYALMRSHNFTGKIWEPAAGKGHILNELTRMGYECIGTDLYDRGTNNIKFGMDFLQSNLLDGVKNIITNPPYKDGIAEEFILRALDMQVEKIAFLCRLQFVTGIGRYNNLYRNKPPSKILIFPRRLLCDEQTANNISSKKQFGGMLEYAWYIWDINYVGDTVTKWLNIDSLADERDKDMKFNNLSNFI